jgi:hypothetical protein
LELWYLEEENRKKIEVFKTGERKRVQEKLNPSLLRRANILQSVK